jgi:hypothetical protein
VAFRYELGYLLCSRVHVSHLFIEGPTLARLKQRVSAQGDHDGFCIIQP